MSKRNKKGKPIAFAQLKEKVAVVWTRVSTREQAENNNSLDTQRKACEDYAEKRGVKIVAYYGGTHESANEEGRLFREMIKAVASKTTVNMILCYTYDRFSRTGVEGIVTKQYLKQKGIYVTSVTQETDPDSVVGELMENIIFLFGQFDNNQRKMKCEAGMTDCLRAGNWYSRPPIGYNKRKVDKNHILEVNDTGKLLRKAFHWKAEEGLTDVKIVERLKNMGLDITKDKLSLVFHNPFYCGYIKHAFLGNEVVRGNQEVLISEDIYNKVNAISTHRDYTHAKVTPDFPLKRHILCSDCGGYLTGYKATQRETKYYKCNTKGCKHNYNSEILHQKYQNLLNRYKIPIELRPIIEKVLVKVFNERNDCQTQIRKALLKKQTSCNNLIEKVDIRFGLGDISHKVYETTMKKLKADLAEVEKALEETRKNLSNMTKFVSDVIAMYCKLGDLWKTGDFDTCQKLQNLVFPKGVQYDEAVNDYRTENENLIFSLFRRISDNCRSTDIKKEPHNCDSSHLVAEIRLERMTFGL